MGPPSEIMSGTKFLQIQRIDEVVYENTELGTHGGEECTAPQKERINKGIDEAMPGIQKGSDFSSNSELVTKWFGSPTSLEPDEHVKKRYDDGIAKLASKDWRNRCCPSVAGG